MLSINYPEKYKEESSRVGKKFKYYKIEPVNMEKKEEKKKEIKIGKTSGRISALHNWSRNPQQGNINYVRESLFEESFSDIIDSYLEELDADFGRSKEIAEGSTGTNSN